MPLKFGLQALRKAYEKQDKKKHWDMWLMRYITMTKDTYKPFEEFHNKKPCSISQKPAEEILKTAYEIRRSLGKI